MLVKKAKNSTFVLLLLLCSAMLLLHSTQPAFAYDFVSNVVAVDPNTGEICPDYDGLTERIVACAKESILYGVNEFLPTFSNALATTVQVACLLGVAVVGVAMATGKATAPVKDSMVMAVKLGAVVLFTDNFNDMFPKFLDMMEEMLSIVTGYMDFSMLFGCEPKTPTKSIAVWQRVDCALDSLIGGIFQPFNIYMGITGFLFAALFSQSVGLFIGLMGLMVISQFIWALIRGVYIFISAYLAFALMVCISPLFIPCVLFKPTFGYFEKWLRITIGFMLQPIFLFTYFAMLTAAFDVVVYTGDNSLYRKIAGREVDNFNQNYRLGDWLLDNGVYAEGTQSGQAFNVDPNKVTGNEGFSIQQINVGVIGAAKDNPNSSTSTTQNVNITEQVTQSSEWRESSGLPKNLFLDRLLPLNYFMVDVPVKVINWKRLSQLNNYSASDPTDYWVDLFLSFIMAVLIAYIFLLMIDLLPFIGTGIAGDALSMPAFGTGPFAPPGDGAMNSFKDRFMGNLIGKKL